MSAMDVKIKNCANKEAAGKDNETTPFYEIPLNDDDEKQITTTCGLGSWHPNWLQVFAKPIFFLMNFMSLDIIQGINYSYIIGISSTLEKRFLYSSKITGLILIADNISIIFLSPILGYLVKHMNASRIAGTAMIFEYFACFVFISPYFIYGPASVDEINSTLLHIKGFNLTNDLCDMKNNDEVCLESASSLTIWPAVYLIWLGIFLNGIGFSGLYTVGFPHIDDNLPKKHAPIYYAGIDVIELTGPAIGYMISSYCLSLPEDFLWSSRASGKVPSTDPKFIGAWWLGSIIISFLMLFSTLPMFLFPKDFHHSKKNVIDTKRDEKFAQTKSKSLREKFVEAKEPLKRLFTNPVWLLDSSAAIFRYLGINGLFVFLPKYIESQFHKTASDASFWHGMYQLISMAIGITLGAIILTCFKPKARILTTFILLVEFVANVTTILGIFLGCPKNDYFAVDNNLQQSCNANCQCSRQRFEIYCSSDGHTNYFSPCFAGCQSTIGLNNTPINCFCESELGYGLSSQLTKGYCESNCDNFQIYMSVMGIGKLIACTANTANLVVKFRSIEPRDKAFAVGIHMTFLGLFAWIPYPLIFGAITDAACAIWQESCGQKGNCWIYDQDKFKIYLHTSSFAFMTMGTILDAIMIYFSKRMTHLYDDDDVTSSVNDESKSGETKGDLSTQ